MPLVAQLPTRSWWEDDWRAHPSTCCPTPVVLLHGTTSSAGDFLELGTELRERGWCVFAPNYGRRATGPLRESAAQVAAYCEQVLQATGAKELILVGHSQGGLIARLLVRYHQIPARFIVTIGAPHMGTTKGGLLSGMFTNLAESLPGGTDNLDSFILRNFGPAGLDQIAGSQLLEQLNSPGEPVTPMLCIATRTDSTVVPPQAAFLGGVEQVESRHNPLSTIYVQDIHPRAVVLHSQMPFDRRVRQLVIEGIEQWRRIGTPVSDC